VAKKKRAGEVNKSKAVRDYLGKNPQAGPKQIVEGLAAQGIEVSRALASVVKYKPGPKKRAAKKRTKKRAARKAGRPARARAGVAAAPKGKANRLTADDLFEAKRLVDSLGGIDEARRALEALEQLR
jgi:hypothetical protein